jgi:hypothetical protein
VCGSQYQVFATGLSFAHDASASSCPECIAENSPSVVRLITYSQALPSSLITILLPLHKILLRNSTRQQIRDKFSDFKRAGGGGRGSIADVQTAFCP